MGMELRKAIDQISKDRGIDRDLLVDTLEEAVRVMGRFQLGMDLPPRDVRQIVAFLNSLTSEELP